MARVSLPGYETPDTPASEALRTSALTAICHPRKTLAETGKAVVGILFDMLTRGAQADSHSRALGFVSDLVDLLESKVEITEKDLARGIVESPLHGVLSATL